MKKNIIILSITFIFIILLISSFVVYAQNEKEEPTLEDKVSEEINYLNNYVISLLGHFNGLTLGSDVSGKLQQTEQLEEKDNNQSEENSQGKTEGSSETENSQSGEGVQGNSGDNTTQGGEEQESNNNAEISTNQNSILANKGKYTSNWTKIEEQTEQLYQIWNTISIDLHGLNIDGKSILAFSEQLNATTQNVKKQDKAKAMQELTTLYQLLPQYRKSYQPDSKETEMLQIQSQVVTAYTFVTNEKWNEAQEQLTQAEQKFATIINTVSEKQQDQTVMNQCYILVNELINAVTLKDKDIFYIQYQNLVNKMTGLL